jgi:hypothetical protein
VSELAGRASFAGVAKLAGAGATGSGRGASATGGVGGGIDVDPLTPGSARLMILGTMGAVADAGAGASARGVVDAGAAPLGEASRLMTFGTMAPLAAGG